jgi:valyl-tRNA synthetase
MINNDIEEELNFVMNIISSIRNIRSELNISPKKEAELICRGPKNKINIIRNNKKYFKSLIKIKSILFGREIDKPNQCSTAVINDVEIFLPLADLINIDKEINRLKSNIEDIEGRMNSVKKKLDNENFLKRAPENIVKHEKEKFSNYKSDYNKLVSNLDSLIS